MGKHRRFRVLTLNRSLWEKLIKFTERGCLMGAGSPEGKDNRVVDGIVQGHAYAILDVQECDGNCLLQLKNPWCTEVNLSSH